MFIGAGGVLAFIVGSWCSGVVENDNDCYWYIKVNIFSYCEGTRIYNHLFHKRTLNHLAKLKIWPNGWVFVYELSGCGFESRCNHLNFKCHAWFEQRVPWHSGKYRTWIHSEMHTWHNKKIQSIFSVSLDSRKTSSTNVEQVVFFILLDRNGENGRWSASDGISLSCSFSGSDFLVPNAGSFLSTWWLFSLSWSFLFNTNFDIIVITL